MRHGARCGSDPILRYNSVHIRIRYHHPTMSEQIKAAIEQALAKYIDPYLRTDLLSAKALKRIETAGGKTEVDLVLGFPCRSYQRTLADNLRPLLQAAAGASSDIVLNIEHKIIPHAVQQGTTPMPEVKNIIAVASGKGGVGKSTIAVNLALALQAAGATVGLLDADIYGPSQPRMLGCHGRPDSIDGKTIEPKVSYHVQSISIGHLIDEEQPMIWRGPMVTSALQQLLRDTNWKGVDYLVIDLPPGTGDIQLTLSQSIPVSGAVIVTTPQDIALLDARKALKMFEKVKVPVIGIIENMSTHICSHCGHEEAIFGSGGGASMAKQYGVDLLGALPLDAAIREGVDNGKPTVAMDPDSRVSEIFKDIALKISAKLSLRAKDYSHKMPKIVIDNT